jgi:hypothetical protein
MPERERLPMNEIKRPQFKKQPDQLSGMLDTVEAAQSMFELVGELPSNPGCFSS